MKTRNLLLGLVAAGLLAGAGAAVSVNASSNAAAPAAIAQDAKTFTHEGAGITFELPAGWKAEPDGEMVTVSPAEGGVALTFWVPDDEDFDAAKSLGEELAKQIQDLKFDGEPKADKYNGMDHSAVSGTGKIEGKEIHFSADILEAKKTLIVLTIGSTENFQKHSAEYSKLVKSIKRIG